MCNLKTGMRRYLLFDLSYQLVIDFYDNRSNGHRILTVGMLCLNADNPWGELVHRTGLMVVVEL